MEVQRASGAISWLVLASLAALLAAWPTASRAPLGKPPYPAARRILEGTNADQVFQDVAQSCLKSRLS